MSAAPDIETDAPRLGFLGTGWIGRHRMNAIASSGAGVVAAVCEPSEDARRSVREELSDCRFASSLDELLEHDLDGVVIATPSALHAEQSIRALERGFAVFCQKPLGRNAAETQRVVDAARAADRLLGVDFSYRFAEAFVRAREIVQSGAIGRVYGVDLAFHNAYGPDKPWFYDVNQAGGGCLIDLGVHLVDYLLWTLEPSRVQKVSGRLFAEGKPLGSIRDRVEDYVVAAFDADDAAVRLACSWRLPAGQDAVIEATFWGTNGGVSVRNVNGSFYDFVAEQFEGTQRKRLVEPPDEWGGRAAVDWARRLGESRSWDASIESVTRAAAILDAIYSGSDAP